MDAAIAAMASVPVTEELKVIRYLPRHLGGLGIHRHHSPTSDVQCMIASRKICMDHMREYRPNLVTDRLVANWTAFSQRVGVADNLSIWPK